MRASFILLVVASAFLNVLTYFDFRELLFSIARFDHPSIHKYSKKISMTNGQSLRSRIEMSYLLEYVKTFKREFHFWQKMMALFVFVQIIILIICIFTQIFLSNHLVNTIAHIIYLVTTVVSLFLLQFQFGLSGRATKYDRLRKNK